MRGTVVTLVYSRHAAQTVILFHRIIAANWRELIPLVAIKYTPF
jgi:hypothetical protein